jgi:hypothetical protein
VSGADVYVAGYEYTAGNRSAACYWKNGVKTILSVSDGRNEFRAEAIAVSGTDVYVAGHESPAIDKTVPLYWKNGVKTALSEAATYAYAKGIALVVR